MTKPIHVYHLWLGGAAKQIAQEHFSHVDETLFSGVFTGLVGPPEARAEAKTWLPCKVIAEADEGFEDVTLRALRWRIQRLRNDTPVFYAHDKGAFHDLPANRVWRREMMRYLFDNTAERIQELAEYDVVSWCWSPKGTCDPYGMPITDAIPAGNFWASTAGYLKKLPEIPELVEDTRIGAEVWIGRGEPSVKSLLHGWPSWRMGMHVPFYFNGFLQTPGEWIPNPDSLDF